MAEPVICYDLNANGYKLDDIIKGSNINEIGVIPKKIKKIGFFEKLFHIFS